MRILSLNNLGVSNAIAKSMTNNNNNKMYYNISLGFGSNDYKMYTIYLSSKHFPVVEEVEELELHDNNYILQPIKIDNKVQKDKNGNINYCIYKGDVNNYKNDIILIWEIPNRRYVNVTYKMDGDVRLLAEATYGQERDGINYLSPIPILEIFGDCEITWSGTDKNNNTVGQVIKYNYALKQWDIKSLSGDKND